MTTAHAALRDEIDATQALCAMIRDASLPPDAMATLLDGLPDEVRPRVVRRLDRPTQRALYEKVAGFRPVRLVDLVAPAKADLEQVRHLGRNTLPAFRIFEKRFCRLPGGSPDAPEALAGYNHQTMAAVTGPGYFMAREDPEHGEILIDYGRLPTSKPGSWPAIRSNERGLGRFVYGFMVDRLRRVSEHVTIGSAARNGRDLGSYFALCRAD